LPLCRLREPPRARDAEISERVSGDSGASPMIENPLELGLRLRFGAPAVRLAAQVG
jgi:hypothetical protein